MPVARIGKTTVDGAQPGPKDTFIWDKELRGFGLKVTTRGAKSYLVQYRMGGRGTPTRRYTIGTHGSPWTPIAARGEAERVLRLVQSGVDPMAADKDRQRAEIDLAFDKYADRYLAEYGQLHWRPGTFKGVESNLRRYVVPKLRHKALPSVTRPDIVAVLDALPRGGKALRRNVYTHVRKLFSWAVERGDIERSPLEGFKGPAVTASRDRILTDNELKLAWCGASGLGYPFGPMIKLLIATGQRRQEVAALDWKELDCVEARWNIPADRSKNRRAHWIPLNSLAMAILDGLAGGETWPHRGHVFTTTGNTPASGHSRAKLRLDEAMSKLMREGAANPNGIDLEPWRLHDIRRSFATGMQRLGVRFEVTEAILNHVSGSKAGVAGVYQRHDWAEEKRDALGRWADHVAGLIAAGRDGRNW